MADSTDRKRDSYPDAGSPVNEAGTMPPSALREVDTVKTSAARPFFKANPALSPGVYPINPPDGTLSSGYDSEALPPEAVGGNPMTLGPDDPNRDSNEGQPYLDDANPYGRPLVNRQNRPMGGIGVSLDPNDQERPLDRTDAPGPESRSSAQSAAKGGQSMIEDAVLSRDEKIARSIEDAIQARMKSDAPPINVAVQGATVTLTGHVANQATKDAVNALARNTEGVLNVTDNLVVGNDRSLLDWFLPTRDENRDLEGVDSAGEM